MVTAASAAAAIADLCAAFMAVEIFSILDPQQLGADPSAQAALLASAVALLLPLAALGTLATTASAIYRHLQHSAAAAGAAGTRRLCRLFALLCGSVGTLEACFFVQPAGVSGDVAAQARALGLAAARVLPAAAAATFFLGMAQIIVVVAHIRAGGEGGGGAHEGFGFAAAVDEQQIQGPVSFLTKAAYAAAAALALLMAMAMALCVGGDTSMIY